MASNTRPKFKHPLPTMKTEPKELSWVTEEELTGTVAPDTGMVQIVWNGLNVFVRRMIGLSEMQNMVDIVLNQCWDGERYRIELTDFQFRCAVVTFYTNINLPESAADQYEYLYGTDLYEFVTPYISKAQLGAIEDSLRMYMSR